MRKYKYKEDALVITKPRRSVTFEINGFVVVLAHVRCVYPVQETNGIIGFEWGIKFTDGFYETFAYKGKIRAANERQLFLRALTAYWEET